MNKLLRDTIMIIKDVHHMNFDYEFVSSLCIYILRKYVSLSELLSLRSLMLPIYRPGFFWSNKNVK